MGIPSVSIELLTEFDGKAKLQALDKAYAIAEFDLAGTLLCANTHYCQMFGYAEHEITGQPHTLFMQPKHLHEHAAFWQKVVTGQISAGEFQRQTRHGHPIWVHAAYTPITDNNNNLIGIIKLALDITDQKYHTTETCAKLNAIECSQGVIEFDAEGYITHINNHYLALTGYTRREILGQHHKLLCPCDYVNHPDYQQFWQKLKRGKSVSGRFQRQGKHNNPFWIQATYSPVIDSDNNVTKIIKYAHDITKNIQTEKKAEQQSLLLDILLSAQDDFLLNHDLASACDKVFKRLLQVTDSEFGFIATLQEEQGEQVLYIPSISNLAWDNDTREWYNQQRKTNGGLIFRNLNTLFGHVVTSNTVVCTNNLPAHPASRGFPHGHPTLSSFLGIPVTYDGQAIGMIALANRPQGYDQQQVELLAPLVKTLGTIIHARSLEDERRQMENVLRFNAEHDFLTGLPNRNHFFRHASQFFNSKSSDSACKQGCLAMIDIDYFKKINDQYGHLTGDAVLKELGRILPQTLRSDDLAARIGGEEFIILLKNIPCHEATAIMQRVRKQIEQHELQYDGKQLKFTISIGVASWRPEFTSVDEWLQQADDNLYHAKRCGRNCVK